MTARSIPPTPGNIKRMLARGLQITFWCSYQTAVSLVNEVAKNATVDTFDDQFDRLDAIAETRGWKRKPDLVTPTFAKLVDIGEEERDG